MIFRINFVMAGNAHFSKAPIQHGCWKIRNLFFVLRLYVCAAHWMYRARSLVSCVASVFLRSNVSGGVCVRVCVCVCRLCYSPLAFSAPHFLAKKLHNDSSRTAAAAATQSATAQWNEMMMALLLLAFKYWFFHDHDCAHMNSHCPPALCRAVIRCHKHD